MNVFYLNDFNARRELKLYGILLSIFRVENVYFPMISPTLGNQLIIKQPVCYNILYIIIYDQMGNHGEKHIFNSENT